MNRSFRGRIARFFRVASVITLVWIASIPEIAFAQAAPAPTGPLHSDAMPYLLIVFCLALGLIVVCRSANRSPEIRLEDLDEL
jgi:hypothetical protein